MSLFVIHIIRRAVGGGLEHALTPAIGEIARRDAAPRRAVEPVDSVSNTPVQHPSFERLRKYQPLMSIN